ncbi:uncharacterized protein LOC126660194 [Mercurialis annua]|uniref:uncharacterized protein LOC126660194 n=1 Tax=Mercurialis annua TaxID=3986 RepID=UPI0024AF26B4|nr:uncharacterized protein LOC126660194 [Mercurialis annua]
MNLELSLSCCFLSTCQFLHCFIGFFHKKQHFIRCKSTLEGAQAKWHGSVGGIVDAPINKVWSVVSVTKRLSEWMPMVENCTDLAGDEGNPGYVRLVSGFMFPQINGERSWIKEKLISIDRNEHSYVYKMEASNVGLDGSINTLKLVDYGDDSTLVNWSFEIDSLDGVSEDKIMDYLGFLYKSCINRIKGALEITI